MSQPSATFFGPTVATSLPIEMLIPSGKALLLGSFGARLVISLRRKESLDEAFIALAVGFFGIIFFQQGADVLDALSRSLSQSISEIGNPAALREYVLTAIQGSLSSDQKINLPDWIEQVWRTGVWGVMSGIADFVFLLVRLLLESARDVFWQMSLFLFPLFCGLWPIAQQPMKAAVSLLVQIALWQPCLLLLDVSASLVARKLLTQSGSLGLRIVAVEVIYALLCLRIPSLTSKWVDGLSTAISPSQTLQSIRGVGSRILRAGKIASVLVAVFLSAALSLSFSTSAFAKGDDAMKSITLYLGFVSRIHCEGRLLISAVGNEALVRREALPAEVGCGLILKPIGKVGTTNLILEASTGSFNLTLDIRQAGLSGPRRAELETFLGQGVHYE